MNSMCGRPMMLSNDAPLGRCATEATNHILVGFRCGCTIKLRARRLRFPEPAAAMRGESERPRLGHSHRSFAGYRIPNADGPVHGSGRRAFGRQPGVGQGPPGLTCVTVAPAAPCWCARPDPLGRCQDRRASAQRFQDASAGCALEQVAFLSTRTFRSPARLRPRQAIPALPDGP